MLVSILDATCPLCESCIYINSHVWKITVPLDCFVLSTTGLMPRNRNLFQEMQVTLVQTLLYHLLSSHALSGVAMSRPYISTVHSNSECKILVPASLQ